VRLLNRTSQEEEWFSVYPVKRLLAILQSHL
jgi:hypothetical protein